MVFPFELGLSHICFPSTQSVTLRSHTVFPRSHITHVPLAHSTGRLRAVIIRHDKQCNISGQRGIWRGAGASALLSTQRLQLRPVMDVARPLKIPGDENHWDWKWAEAIFTKGPVAACYTHGDTSGKWRHRYRAVLELLAKWNEAPCNVAIMLDCGVGGMRGRERGGGDFLCWKSAEILLLVSHACGACGSNQQLQIDCCSW